MAAGKKIKIGVGDDMHIVTLPPEPTDKTKILNYNEKPENAYWKRQMDFPKTWWAFNKSYTELNKAKTIWDTDTGKLLALSRQDTEILLWYQTRELERRRDGVWCKMNTKIIWICGDYYHVLQWCAMLDLPEKYGTYLHFQNDFLILKWYVRNHPTHLGMGVSKPKKTGITQIMMAAIENEATILMDKQFGVMSKDFKDDTKETNMAMMMYIIDNLPDILIPGIKKRNEQALWFGIPVGKLNGSGVVKALNTRVNAKRTKVAGFDGPKPWLAYIDEIPKIYKSAKVRVQSLFEKTLAAVKLQQKKNGIFIWTSYSPEEDDLGFSDVKDIVRDSALSTIGDNPLGRTKSGLIYWHIDALDATFGCHDKYGWPDRAKALRLNQAERDQAKGNKAKLQAVIRQGARTKEEAFGVGGISTVFNSIRIGFRIADIEEQQAEGVRLYTEGKLSWENVLWEGGKFDKRKNGEYCNIIYEKLETDEIMAGMEGRYRQFVPLKAADTCRSIRLNKRDAFGHLMPAPGIMNAAGMDITDYRNASDVEEGSKNSFMAGNLYDLRRENEQVGSSNIILGEYWFEAENPEETYQDAVKFMLYHDLFALVEPNKKWMATRLILDGLGNFLLIRKEDGTIAPFKYGEKYDLINTTDDLWEQMILSIRRYIAPVEAGELDIDYLQLMKSVRTLMQLTNFKADVPKSRRKSDNVVALGLLRIAVESLMIWLTKKDTTSYDKSAVKTAWAQLVG